MLVRTLFLKTQSAHNHLYRQSTHWRVNTLTKQFEHHDAFIHSHSTFQSSATHIQIVPHTVCQTSECYYMSHFEFKKNAISTYARLSAVTSLY